ncbi:ferritin-like domain-containing protein [Saccharopolyspora sp. HNM0983]|uniref:Ferritin-like domain-containing protein n=1 Tax=Saccharopolyspora montiporae TaxID=2781240 RepID=A0A929BA95_9PSEU|nr:ferritin-like domain-containing protein [Saccharopolyspora sp. HNM0983]MBE9374321.1 ferritin-like domain-containing protein [Saccharopolyspora sp. HNM0983]
MSDPAPEAVEALRSALQAEHAALWTCGLATAFAGAERVSSAVHEATAQHERLRDGAEQALRRIGQTPPAARPAYDVGSRPEDENSMIRVLITAETDCQVGWRSVLDTAGDRGVRELALDGLTTAATRATRWRITVGERPAAAPLPGDPRS